MPPKCPPEIRPNDRVIGATGFCLNRVGLVVRVEGQGLAKRFFVHWDDHPAKESPHALARRSIMLYEEGMVLTLRKRHDKNRKRKNIKEGGSSGSDGGAGGEDMQSDEEVHVEGGTEGNVAANKPGRGEGSDSERSDGSAAAAVAAASATSNDKYNVLIEPSPSCLPSWAFNSLEHQNITSFGALQEEIAGLSFKLVDWEERSRTSHEKSLKNTSQLSVHELAASQASLLDDRAFHREAAVQKRADIEHTRRVAAARAPVRALLRDEHAAARLELRFAEELTLQCVPLPLGRRFFCPIAKCSTHLTFGFPSTESLKTHVNLSHGTTLEAYAKAHGWEQLGLLHSLGSLINHAVAATSPAQATRSQGQSSFSPGAVTDAMMLERRRRGICLLIEHMNEHARDRAERRVCRQRLRQQRADRLAAASALCERWAAAAPDSPAAITVLTEALAIANNQHEVRENVLLRSGCFPHIRRSLEVGAEAQQQLALALVRALCTSRHNRRELRRAGVISPLIMLLLPTVAVQQQAGAAAAILALVQGDRSSGGRSTNALGCNVPNLKLLADHPDAATLLEAVVAAGKVGSNILGAHLQVGISDAGSFVGVSASNECGAVAIDAKHDSASKGALVEVSEGQCVTGCGKDSEIERGDSCETSSSKMEVTDAPSDTNSTTVVSAPVEIKKERLVETAAASSAAAAFAAADAGAILSLLRHTLPQAIAARLGTKGGGIVNSDPDALPPPPPGESSGASHTSSEGTKKRRSTSLQEAKRMLADVVAQTRAASSIGGVVGAAGPLSQLPSYSRAYDMALSVAKWGQSSGDGIDHQEEVKRQKRALMRAAREAAREASAVAAAASAASAVAASVSFASNEGALDASALIGVKVDGKGRSGTTGMELSGRDDRKRRREGLSLGAKDGKGGEAVTTSVSGISADVGSDEEIKSGNKGAGDVSGSGSHMRASIGMGGEDADLRFADLSEEKAASLDAQGAVKIDGLVMWEALAGASQSLLQHRKSGYFLEPVDPIAMELNDYFDVVKEPSDLGTVCSRVQRQCNRNLRLRYSYNPPDHPVHKDADQMRSYWRSVTLKRVAKSLPFPVVGCISSSDSRHRVLLNWSSRVEREVGTSTGNKSDDGNMS